MTDSLQEFQPQDLCPIKQRPDYFWQFNSKGPQDFSVYTEKSSIYETPTKEKFRESADVLVRWTDGLLYLAKIVQVEDEYNRCAVKFEDGSQFWALYKDIYKGASTSGEIACTVCDSSSSHPPDEIVICKNCSVGYHQSCHIPSIESSFCKLGERFICRKCIFALSTKKGGCLKKGPNAQEMMKMKQTLPYDLNLLSWDGSHRSNLQQTYCYCGGPGEWFMKMLQCNRCKQWFHEACVQCLDDPILFGDRFYIFVCSVCNKGPEFLRRLPLRWPDIAHLVLFNLTVIHGKKYFDLDTVIMTFLKEKWSQFKIKGEEAPRRSNEGRRQKMLEILQNSKSRFTTGKEMKTKVTIWGLKCRVPPPGPAITLPPTGVINDEVLDIFYSNGKKAKIAVKPTNNLPLKRTRRPVLEVVDVAKTVQRTEKSVASTTEKEKKKTELPKKVERRKSKRNMLPVRLNGARKFSRLPTFLPFSDSDTPSAKNTLNKIIPLLTNFEGKNNPFLSNKNGKPVTVSTRARSKSEPQQTKVQSARELRSQRRCKVTNGSPVVNGLPNGTTTPSKTIKSVETRMPTRSSEIKNSVGNCFNVEKLQGEKYSVVAKRTAPDGKVQYLIEWEQKPS